MKVKFSYVHMIELVIVANVWSIVLLNNKQSPLYNPLLMARVFYIIEIIAFFLCVIIGRHLELRFGRLFLIILFSAGQIAAYTYANKTSFLIAFSIHRVLLWSTAVYIFYFCADMHRWTKKEFHRILNLLVFLGMVACLYNIFANMNNFWEIMQRPSLYITYRSLFKSFFPTKSVFAMLVFFSSCAALYFTSINKKIYYLYYGFFLINVILSSARSIVVVMLFALMAFEIRNKKFLYAIVFLIIVLFAVYYIVNRMGRTEFMDAFLFHDRSGTDISSGRFSAWQTFFKRTNYIRLIIGYGFGSNNALPGIYSRNFALGSYHSMYIDSICQGGLIYLLIMLYFLINSFVSIWKSNAIRQIKVLFGVMIISYAGVMVTDSLGTLFETQFWSFLSSIFIITLPTGIAAQGGELK